MPIRRGPVGSDILRFRKGDKVAVTYVDDMNNRRTEQMAVQGVDTDSRSGRVQLKSGSRMLLADQGARPDVYAKLGQAWKRAGRVVDIRPKNTGGINAAQDLVDSNNYSQLRAKAKDMELTVPDRTTKRDIANLIAMRGDGSNDGPPYGGPPDEIPAAEQAMDRLETVDPRPQHEDEDDFLFF